MLCFLLSSAGDDIWKFKLPDGRTPRQAIEFIFPYLADKNKWLADGYRRDISHWENMSACQPFLIFAYAEFGDPKYFELWQRLDADPANSEVRRNLAITQPILWLTKPRQVPLLK